MSVTKEKSDVIYALMLLLCLLLCANISKSERLTFKVGGSRQGINSGDHESPLFPMLPRGPVPPSGPNPDSPPFKLDGHTSKPTSVANNLLP
ncbi:hypothetical protein HAX54_013592 [Datura stramonium]|uniref:Uncharacterized protein n=1 Tax=Datura stramonium TaxID=4076 RepID=A0ABS8TNE9_DATST|nr:hypothetical protein [Datura stramonium]